MAIGSLGIACPPVLYGDRKTLAPAIVATLSALDPKLRPVTLFNQNGDPFQSEYATTSKYWRARLRDTAARAGVAGFRPHRLRDTFAVALLTAGVAMEDVSALLGHSSIRTTERHYAPWDRRRRDRLAQVVRAANRLDPLLVEMDPLGTGTRVAR